MKTITIIGLSALSITGCETYDYRYISTSAESSSSAATFNNTDLACATKISTLPQNTILFTLPGNDTSSTGCHLQSSSDPNKMEFESLNRGDYSDCESIYDLSFQKLPQKSFVGYKYIKIDLNYKSKSYINYEERNSGKAGVYVDNIQIGLTTSDRIPLFLGWIAGYDTSAIQGDSRHFIGIYDLPTIGENNPIGIYIKINSYRRSANFDDNESFKKISSENSSIKINSIQLIDRM